MGSRWAAGIAQELAQRGCLCFAAEVEAEAASTFAAVVASTSAAVAACTSAAVTASTSAAVAASTSAAAAANMPAALRTSPPVVLAVELWCRSSVGPALGSVSVSATESEWVTVGTGCWRSLRVGLPYLL